MPCIERICVHYLLNLLFCQAMFPDSLSLLHSTIIFVYNAWRRARVCTGPVSGTQAHAARGRVPGERLLCWSRRRRRWLRPHVPEANILRQAACLHTRAPAWHAAATTPRLPWTQVASKRGPEEPTVWPKDLASTFSAR